MSSLFPLMTVGNRSALEIWWASIPNCF